MFVRSHGIERALSWRLLGEEYTFSPVQITQVQDVLFASAETRRGREEAEKVRCAPPLRLVTSSMKHLNCLERKALAERIVQGSVKIVSLVFGQT